MGRGAGRSHGDATDGGAAEAGRRLSSWELSRYIAMNLHPVSGWQLTTHTHTHTHLPAMSLACPKINGSIFNKPKKKKLLK
jgi:hypothetical protein